ncbi:MAG: hypothetical protein ACXWTU_05860 [Methylotenera sp.]
MTTLNDLTNKTLKRVKITQGGNVFTDGKLTCLLKPTNRDFASKTKKPVYYLSAIANGKSEYLSGMFRTSNDAVFNADFKDALGLKHIVLIECADQGQLMTVRAA